MKTFVYAIILGFTIQLFVSMQVRAEATADISTDLSNLNVSVNNLAAVVHGLAAYPAELTLSNRETLVSVYLGLNQLASDLAAKPTNDLAFSSDLVTCSNSIMALDAALTKDGINVVNGKTSDSILFLSQQKEKAYQKISEDLAAFDNYYARLPGAYSNVVSVVTNAGAKITNTITVTNLSMTNFVITARLTSILESFGQHLRGISPEVFPPAPKMYTGAFIQKTNTFSPIFSITSGARFTSPYSLSLNPGGTNATLAKNAKSTVTFLDLKFFNRYVMHPSHDEYYDFRQRHFPLFHTDVDYIDLLDLSLRTGFNFDSGTSSTNISASTVVGSGDYYMRADVGVPLYRRDHRTWREQFTVEISQAASTDYNFLEVHPEFFSGLGYQVSFPNLTGSTNGQGYIFARFGASRIDSPAFSPIGPSDTTITVPAPGGLPAYHGEWVPTGGATVMFPIGDVSLWLEANIYAKSSPAPWNVSIGAALTDAQIVSIFKGGQ